MRERIVNALILMFMVGSISMTVTFAIMKVINYVDWPWVVVATPFLGVTALIAIVFIISSFVHKDN